MAAEPVGADDRCQVPIINYQLLTAPIYIEGSNAKNLSPDMHFFIFLHFFLIPSMLVASSPPTYANKYESTSPKRLMETKTIFVLIQSRYRCVVLPVQSVAN